ESKEPAALMKVGGRVRRIKGVQVEVVKLLRKDREAGRQSIVLVDDVVDARERVETLALNIALAIIESFQARHLSTYETIFETLEKEELVFLDWSTNGDSRRGRADAEDRAVAPARPWQHTKDEVQQVVAARACLNRRHSSRKLPKLRRVRVRVDLHCIDSFQRQLNRRRPGNRIGDVET